jgi:hypothetical protein
MSALVKRLRLELGQRLGQVVASSGKSHEEFARMVGTYQGTLSACIRGEMSVERIARILEEVGEDVAFKSQDGA